MFLGYIAWSSVGPNVEEDERGFRYLVHVCRKERRIALDERKG